VHRERKRFDPRVNPAVIFSTDRMPHFLRVFTMLIEIPVRLRIAIEMRTAHFYSKTLRIAPGRRNAQWSLQMAFFRLIPKRN
jgi:hypothetical protein